MKKLLQLIAFAVLSVAGAAQAAVIQSAVSATASSTFAGCCEIERTIDQSGLLTGFVSGVTNFDTYMAGNPIHDLFFGGEWFSDNAQRATVTYDMGGVFVIDRMAYWNEDAANGFLQLDVFGSVDGITYFLLASGLTPTDHPIVNYPADVFGWGAQSMRYVRFEMQCDWCSIGEVAFSVVPEPQTMALFGLALAGLGMLRRRQH